MKITSAQRNFIQKEALEFLKELNSERQAEWGVFTAQAMVEHLAFTFHYSKNNDSARLVPEEKLARSVAFLWSDRILPKFVTFPNSDAQSPPHKFADIHKAREILAENINGFYQYYQAYPENSAMHPYFGILDFNAWEQFHFKHLMHHLTQFGLINQETLINQYIKQEKR